MRPMRPTGTIKAPKFWTWDEADAEAMAHQICSTCLKLADSRVRATHRIDAECGCGHHQTMFCGTHTREFANVLESTCGDCGKPRVFSEPLEVDRAPARSTQLQETSDPPAVSGPDLSYLGEEADEWLA
jgi:hypothetical protein